MHTSARVVTLLSYMVDILSSVTVPLLKFLQQPDVATANEIHLLIREDIDMTPIGGEFDLVSLLETELLCRHDMPSATLWYHQTSLASSLISSRSYRRNNRDRAVLDNATLLLEMAMTPIAQHIAEPDVIQRLHRHHFAQLTIPRCWFGR